MGKRAAACPGGIREPRSEVLGAQWKQVGGRTDGFWPLFAEVPECSLAKAWSQHPPDIVYIFM